MAGGGWQVLEVRDTRWVSPGLMQPYRDEQQTRHYARRQVGSAEVSAFLSRLAVDLTVSATAQDQALAALLLLDRELLERDPELEDLVRKP
ncbi:MAG: hypothetical protein R6W87_10795 [Halospina sp.]